MSETPKYLYPEWGWWAGRSADLYNLGPFDSKGAAISEALDLGEYDEIETDDGWRRVVYYAECRNLHFDCDECGIVPEACEACRDYLFADETAGTFADRRNDGCEMFGYEDEGAT